MFVRAYLQERTPAAFAPRPMLWEAVREWIAQRLKVHAREVGLSGSAQSGFSVKNKIGAAFATGGQVSSGKEVTMLTILAAMLGNQMIVVSGGGAFGASATTEGDSPGIDNKESADAKALGRRVAEVAVQFKAGSAK